MFSTRTIRDRTPNRLAVALDEERARGRALLDLTVSNPTTAGIPYPADEILRALADPAALVYAPEPFGLETARAAVSAELARHGVTCAPSRIVLTASTSEAYAFVLDLLCDPGDEVLVPAPSYPLLEHLATLEGVHLAPYRLAYDGEWHVDLESVRAARTRRTRAILIVTPNNPTGSFLKRDELAALGALGLPIVSDEVFAPYAFGADARRAQTALESHDVLVFALSGLSKLAGLPQLKLAWMAVGGPDALVAEALARLELVADTFLSLGTPVQLALPGLLATAGPIRDAIRARTAENLATARRAVHDGSAATLLGVEGGWYATIRVPRTRTEEEWALTLLRDDGVYIHPGWFFDFAEEAHVVVSLLTPTADFAEGLSRLVARVDSAA